MLDFYNNGELDIRLLTSFGVNVKETDSPIGQFGTGLKYAIATILRGGGKIEVWSGEHHYELSTQTETIRGKTFLFVTLNGNRTDFTIALGAHWEPWMAYRELFSNAIDEHGGVIETEEISPEEGTTHVLVTWDQFNLVYKNHFQFFLPTDIPPFYTDGNFNAYRLGGNVNPGIYYRGVRVMKLERSSSFAYEFKSGLELTEDRTISNWAVESKLIAQITSSTNAEFIIAMQTAKTEFESNLNFEWSYTPGEIWLNTCETLYRKNLLSNSATKRLLANRPRSKVINEIPISSLPLNQRRALEKSLPHAQKLFPNETLTVHITNDLPDDTYGSVINRQIWLSPLALSAGTKQTFMTIIEEAIHYTTGASDFSRKFQEKLLSMLADTYELSLGDSL